MDIDRLYVLGVAAACMGERLVHARGISPAATMPLTISPTRHECSPLSKHSYKSCASFKYTTGQPSAPAANPHGESHTTQSGWIPPRHQQERIPLKRASKMHTLPT
eukprot:240227-Prorocentrum_minimum.AAC.4